MIRLTFCAVALSILAAAPATFADAPAKAQTSVAVTGEGGKADSLDFATLDKLPQRRVQAEARGHKADCSGANLIDVLAQVGAPSGEKLRGKDLSLYVRIRGADGYQVVYALAELDPLFRGDEIPVLTHQCEGKPLDAKDGPFRIVAPGEKRPARWIRQVIAIDLLRTP